MKLIVKPKGNFMLILDRGEVVETFRPSVVTEHDFLNSHIALGRIEVLKRDLPDEAMDKDFLKWFKDSDGKEELAIQSFMSSFEPKVKSPEK